MFVIESERVACLVADNAAKFGIRHAHREAFKVQRRLVVIDLENLGADVGPVACDIVWTVEAGDAHLAGAACFRKHHVRGLVPGVHVPQDPRPQVPWRRIEELHRQPDTRGRPAPADDDGEPRLTAAAADWSPRHDAMLGGVGRIDVNRPPCGRFAAADRQ